MDKIITRSYSQSRGEKIRQVLLRRKDQFVQKELIQMETGLTNNQITYVLFYALRKGWVQKTYTGLKKIYVSWKKDYMIAQTGPKFKIIYTDLWTNLYS